MAECFQSRFALLGKTNESAVAGNMVVGTLKGLMLESEAEQHINLCICGFVLQVRMSMRFKIKLEHFLPLELLIYFIIFFS